MPMMKTTASSMRNPPDGQIDHEEPAVQMIVVGEPSVVLWDDGSFRLGMVGKRREVVQVPTKQGNQISLRFLLKPLLKSHTQRCHVDGYQEAHLVAVRDSSQPGAQRITEGWLFFHQCIEIDG